jgi:O-6-methylguanine DNA methyltransferase
MFTDTPAGMLLLMGDSQVITGMHWKVFKRAPLIKPDWIEDPSPFLEVLRQLDEYFAGKRHAFDFAYKASGTPFQISVWNALTNIPFGATATYGEIAVKIGRPHAVRAVGTAVGSNPISIVVPCHRVLGFGGRIAGYAGGLESKAALLRLENIAYRD